MSDAAKIAITALLTFMATAYWTGKSMQDSFVSKEFYAQDQKSLQALQQKQFDFISQQLMEIKENIKDLKK
jgi:hypothetical protein